MCVNVHQPSKRLLNMFMTKWESERMGQNLKASENRLDHMVFKFCRPLSFDTAKPPGPPRGWGFSSAENWKQQQSSPPNASSIVPPRSSLLVFGIATHPGSKRLHHVAVFRVDSTSLKT